MGEENKEITGTGSVKFFKSEKGFGFVTLDQPYRGIEEVFVHYTVICGQPEAYKCLKINQKVDIKFTQTEKGLRANSVTVQPGQQDDYHAQHYHGGNDYHGGGFSGGYDQGYPSWGYGNGSYGNGSYGNRSYGTGGFGNRGHGNRGYAERDYGDRGGYGFDEY